VCECVYMCVSVCTCVCCVCVCVLIYAAIIACTIQCIRLFKSQNPFGEMAVYPSAVEGQ